MTETDTPLSGSELVLVAQIPRAGGRWRQVHFNVDIGRQFFRQAPRQQRRPADFERVDPAGTRHGSLSRPVVFSERNRNYKIEFDFGDQREYPEDGIPLLVVLELEVGRTYRYLLLVPGQPGYDEMWQLNQSQRAIGAGHRRVITTLDEVELRWPESPLRSPS